MIYTPADDNVALAVAIGRFSQACNYLEAQLIFTLTRLLPLTEEMGRVLFVGNQIKRNCEILRALMLLPEVAITPETRERLLALVPKIVTLNEDRSRLMHNRITGGIVLAPGTPPEPLMIAIDKQDGKSSAMYPLTVEFINERTSDAKALWTQLYINPVEYDLSQWGSAFQSYPVKDYPTAPQPKAGGRKRQRRSDQKPPAAPDTTQKSEVEPPR